MEVNASRVPAKSMPVPSVDPPFDQSVLNPGYIKGYIPGVLTGSAGWMYRLLIETLLGINLEGDQLRLTPRLPREWTTCTIHHRYRQTVYHLTLTRLVAGTADADQLFLEGKELAGNTVPLVDDRCEHAVGFKILSAGEAGE